VHVCEQARSARSVGNSFTENVCMYYYDYIQKRVKKEKEKEKASHSL